MRLLTCSSRAAWGKEGGLEPEHRNSPTRIPPTLHNTVHLSPMVLHSASSSFSHTSSWRSSTCDRRSEAGRTRRRALGHAPGRAERTKDRPEGVGGALMEPWNGGARGLVQTRVWRGVVHSSVPLDRDTGRPRPSLQKDRGCRTAADNHSRFEKKTVCCARVNKLGLGCGVLIFNLSTFSWMRCNLFIIFKSLPSVLAECKAKNVRRCTVINIKSQTQPVWLLRLHTHTHTHTPTFVAICGETSHASEGGPWI